MATNYNPRTVTDGLVLCLDAGNTKSYPGTGTTWTDISRNGNDGSLVNMDGTNFNSSNGGSLTFDGSNEYVKFGSSIQPSNISVSIWVQPNTSMLSGGYKAVIDKSSSWYMFLNNGTPIFFINGDFDNATSSVTLTSDWYNLVGVYDQTNIYIYVNGILTGTTSYTSSINNNSNPIEILSRSTIENKANNYKSDGKASNVQIYNKALTAAEVEQNFNALRGRFGI